MKESEKFTFIINRGIKEGFEVLELRKMDFLQMTAGLLRKPRKVFLGLGDFLEVGDYSKLLDTLFFNVEGVKIEKLLDEYNRKISADGNIPLSFFKIAVYYPDFLLKDVPTFCVSVIGKKSRLFPGAENFIRYIKDFDPLILTAMPYEIAIEFGRRLDLNDENLLSTSYITRRGGRLKDVYAGGVNRFVSGNRKSIEIEKRLTGLDLRNEDAVYIGRGEAGVKTFSHVNSVAFNPPVNIMPESRITLYGSSLESLLVLFNFGDKHARLLISDAWEQYMPSLIVYSEVKEKSEELIEIEKMHLKWQDNIIAQRIEHSGESYKSVEREIEVILGGYFVDMKEVREMINSRMKAYRNSPEALMEEIYRMASARYTNLCSAR